MQFHLSQDPYSMFFPLSIKDPLLSGYLRLAESNLFLIYLGVLRGGGGEGETIEKEKDQSTGPYGIIPHA